MAKEIQLTYTAHVTEIYKTEIYKTEIYKNVDVGLLDPDREKNTIIRDLERMVEVAGAVPAITIKDFKVSVIDGEETT